MIQIYHNPRCSKSREGLQIVQESGKKFEIIEYMKNPPTQKELAVLVKELGIQPIDLVRKNESIWKEKYKGKILSDNQILEAMSEHPNLIERPIVVNGMKAVLGRPPELIKNLL